MVFDSCASVFWRSKRRAIEAAESSNKLYAPLAFAELFVPSSNVLRLSRLDSLNAQVAPMHKMTRRSVMAGGLTATLAGQAIVTMRPASAELPTLPPLSSSDALLLRPGDAHFADYQTSFTFALRSSPISARFAKRLRRLASWSIGADTTTFHSLSGAAGIPTRAFRKARASLLTCD